MNQLLNEGTKYMDSKIHPDDLLCLTRNGVHLLKLFYTKSIEERADYKLISEYRILNSENNYIRVIEQQQVLELDNSGNIWLALGIIDVSPNQDSEEGIKTQLINYKMGQILPFDPLIAEFQQSDYELTKRETEILQLVKNGFLSKEISDLLSISVHTVNTHRQNILLKLDVDNSMEAVSYATKFGLL
jgi:DNA-binding CsgD family transcriptional regulator